MKQEHNTSDEQLRRITAMETILQNGKRIVKQAEIDLAELEQAAEGLASLNEYYGSPLWWEDFDADEGGKLPADLARGVLSEDEAYNLLEDYRELLKRMAALAKAVLPEEGRPEEPSEPAEE